MNKLLKPWHYAWLMSHPHRSWKWLSDMLKHGFDIHHIDGEKSNNSPSNLVLIECTDHMMLHGSTANRLKLLSQKGKKRSRKERKEISVYVAKEEPHNIAHLLWLAEEDFICKSLAEKG